jgi:hypothetical protein
MAAMPLIAKADIAIVINEQRIVSRSKKSHAEWSEYLIAFQLIPRGRLSR